MKERKQSRKYIAVYAMVALIMGGVVAGLTFVADPLFQYHMPWFGKEAYVYDERYQNPGLAKNADYNAIIVGSSMSENFNCEWFDEGFGVNTLKLTYSGCSAQNWVIAVTLAEENKNVKYVFSNIDIEMLEQEYGKVKFELPQYLYNDNYFDDVYYLWNKDILFERTFNILQNNYSGNLKNAYSWYDSYKGKIGHNYVLEGNGYKGEIKNMEQDITMDENIIKVVKQIKENILKYPDTTFQLFYSPYSIIFYYDKALSGELDKIMKIYEYSMKELLECENCKLYFPSYNNIEMIADLDSYKDLLHYVINIQYTIFEEMRDGVNRVTEDNYKDIISWFRNEILNYDYKLLYEKYD